MSCLPRCTHLYQLLQSLLSHLTTCIPPLLNPATPSPTSCQFQIPFLSCSPQVLFRPFPISYISDYYAVILIILSFTVLLPLPIFSPPPHCPCSTLASDIPPLSLCHLLALSSCQPNLTEWSSHFPFQNIVALFLISASPFASCTEPSFLLLSALSPENTNSASPTTHKYNQPFSTLYSVPNIPFLFHFLWTLCATTYLSIHWHLANNI